MPDLSKPVAGCENISPLIESSDKKIPTYLPHNVNTTHKLV